MSIATIIYREGQKVSPYWSINESLHT